ncbi:MAG: hypothetical protein QNJ54_38110 [Prochloraceae cyanobacterium]|nr:hypothetical protein [Prochloraceae cyanobacterium]
MKWKCDRGDSLEVIPSRERSAAPRRIAVILSRSQLSRRDRTKKDPKRVL